MGQLGGKKNQRSKESIRTLESSFERSAVNEEERTIEVSISSEQAQVQRWWGTEVLGHQQGEVRLDRLRTVGSFMFHHGRDPQYGSVPIGPIKRVWLDEQSKKLRAEVGFDKDEDSERLWQKVLSGSLRGISIRYATYAELEVKPGNTMRGVQGPAYIAVDWEPIEISLEPTPADPNVGVGRSGIEDEEGGSKNERRSETNMGDEMKKENTAGAEEMRGESAPSSTLDEAAVRESAVKAERERVTEITALCRNFDVDPQEHISQGRSVEEVRKLVLDKLANKRQPVASARVTADERDKFRAATVDGLLLRENVTIDKPADGAGDFRGIRLVDLARECVERSTGERIKFGASDEDIFRSAISGTSDFPLILSNVANKAMDVAFQAAPVTFEAWTKQSSLNDFKPAWRLRLSEADEMLEMTEHGEFKHAEIDEAGQYIQLGTYGRSFSMTRKALINDDLSVLTDIPMKYVMAGRRQINKQVYDVLNNNVKIYDGKALFHTDHANLAGIGAAPSIESLGAARAAMKKHTNIRGKEKLNISPEFILVPVEIETLTEQLIGSIVDPTKYNSTMNPFANKLKIISDAELSDPKAWFLIASPMLVTTVEVSYLNGRERPTLESQESFDMLGLKWRIYHDWAVSAIEYRGAYKNPGPSE